MVHPRFLFRQVSTTFEIWSGAKPAEAQQVELFDSRSDSVPNGLAWRPFNREGFIHDLSRVARLSSAHQNRTVKISIAWVRSFKLVALKHTALFKGKR